MTKKQPVNQSANRRRVHPAYVLWVIFLPVWSIPAIPTVYPLMQDITDLIEVPTEGGVVTLLSWALTLVLAVAIIAIRAREKERAAYVEELKRENSLLRQDLRTERIERREEAQIVAERLFEAQSTIREVVRWHESDKATDTEFRQHVRSVLDALHAGLNNLRAGLAPPANQRPHVRPPRGGDYG